MKFFKKYWIVLTSIFLIVFVSYSSLFARKKSRARIYSNFNKKWIKDKKYKRYAKSIYYSNKKRFNRYRFAKDLSRFYNK